MLPGLKGCEDVPQNTFSLESFLVKEQQQAREWMSKAWGGAKESLDRSMVRGEGLQKRVQTRECGARIRAARLRQAED